MIEHPLSIKTNRQTSRVAIIAGTYQPERCGVAHYTAHLRNFLKKYAVESVVLTTHSAAQTINDPSVRGVVQDWRLADLIPLVRAIGSTNADILHIQHAAGTYGFQRPIFLLPLILRASGYQKPIVTTIHEYGWWEWQPSRIPHQLLEWLKQWGQQRGWWDREDGFLLTGSEAIITTNADAETVIHARLPQLANPVYRIPIGANVEVATIERLEARQQLRQQYNWSDDALVIVFFGFLHPVKGLETLLPAFKRVLAKQPQARLLLVGGVESLALRADDAKRYWDKLHTLVAELDLNQKVQMTGYVNADTASHYLTGADMGVLPFNHGVTLKSGSLLALFAHRLPVVATRREPPDQELGSESLIHLVPPRDVDALSAALLKLVTNPTMREQLATTSDAFVRRFSWSDIAQKHLEVYKNLLQF